MAVTLALTGRETTDRRQIILTDATADWGASGNINFTAVQYAEMYVGIRGSLYGPVILTSIFTAATAQSDLVFTLTPQLLGLSETLFDDALHEYHYGVSNQATPPTIQTDVWPLATSFSLPFSSTTNKIPFTVTGSDVVRSYSLSLRINIGTNDESINPRIVLNVNYQDGTTDTATQTVPKDGADNDYTLTVNVNRAKAIKDVTGYLLQEDRTISSGRSVAISNIRLFKNDLDLISNVIRGLASEKTKAILDRESITFQDDFLCGRVDFDKHERFIIRDVAFRSVTNASKQGLPERAERIIDFLDQDASNT